MKTLFLIILTVCLQGITNAQTHKSLCYVAIENKALGLDSLIFAVIIVGFVILWYFLYFKKLMPCKECGWKTINKDENQQPLCLDCKAKLELQQKIDQKIAGESIRKCGHCQTEMKKITYPDFDTLLKNDKQEIIIIDKCPNCKGVFLDSDELEKINKIIEKEAKEKNSSGPGFGTGLLLGIIMSD